MGPPSVSSAQLDRGTEGHTLVIAYHPSDTGRACLCRTPAPTDAPAADSRFEIVTSWTDLLRPEEDGPHT